MKTNINDEYRKIINDIQKHFEDPEEFAYVKSQFEKLSMLFIKEMEDMTKKYEVKMDELEANQNGLEQKLKEIQKVVSSIEKDIYDGEVDEESYEFEVSCPYCNYEFVAELDELKEEIQCPECGNVIELDWENSEEENESCHGNCACCHEYEEDNEDNDEDEDM